MKEAGEDCDVVICKFEIIILVKHVEYTITGKYLAALHRISINYIFCEIKASSGEICRVYT
jgi:hypothetical protein